MCYRIEQANIVTHFYRGDLAGLSQEERQRAQHERWQYRFSRPPKRLLSMPAFDRQDSCADYKANTRAPLGSSLEDTLKGMTKKDLLIAARRIDPSAKSSMRRDDLIVHILDHITASEERLRLFVASLDTVAFDTLIQALSGSSVESFTDENGTQTSFSYLHPIPNLVPFAFNYSDGGALVCRTPEELRKTLSGVDLTQQNDARSARVLVGKALHAHTTLCGVVALDDVYHWINTDLQEDIDRATFDTCVEQLAGTRPDATYTLAVIGGIRYVRRQEYCVPCTHEAYLRNQPGYRRAWYETKDERTQRYWASTRFLAERHKSLASRMTGLSLCGNEIASFVYNLPSVVALTSYFDAHVPRNESDLTFADFMVDRLIGSFLVGNAKLVSVLKELTNEGWFLSEGSNVAVELTMLVRDLYLNLPRWEFNGWSQREYLDMLDVPCLISESSRFYENLDLAS